MKRIFYAILALPLIAAALFSCAKPLDTSYANSASALVSPNWPRNTIYTGLLGADGVDLVDDGTTLWVATAWEQSNKATVSWTTDRIGWSTAEISGVSGAEDAELGDFNGDGMLDVAIAASAAQRVYISTQIAPGVFGPATVLPASAAHGRWLQVDSVDWDSDGDLDILAGGYSTGAVLAWFENGASWAYHKLSDVGWTMSLDPGDFNSDGLPDVFVTDRNKIGTSWALYGARWIDNSGSGHQISCPGANSGCTPGGEMMGSVTATGFFECQSAANKPNRLLHRTASNPTDWTGATWTDSLIPNPGFAHGYCQSITSADLDMDGLDEVVVSAWGADGAASGVWASSFVGGVWTHVDISGPDGVKHDNLVFFDVDGDGDLDIVDSEQVENLGLYWYENPIL